MGKTHDKSHMKTIESHKFILTECDGDANHNKWWKIELLDDDSVVTSWARVGKSAQSKTFPNAGKRFLEKKIAEKIKKGYSKLKVIEQGQSVEITNGSNLKSIARSQILKSNTNTLLSDLIDRLVESNIHTITSNTQITYNSGIFSTPLGIVTSDALIDARRLLGEIAPIVRNHKSISNGNELLSQYLRLIPQDIGMKKFNISTIIPDDAALQKQMQLVDSLEASYNAITPNINDNTLSPHITPEAVFKVDLDILQDSKEYNRLVNWVKTTNHSVHGYGSVKIQNIYSIKIHQNWNNFNDTLSDMKEVFHGSNESNLLSILKSGLKVSPPSTTYITGKLFGDGHYGALDSSKSLQYTFGKFSGQRAVYGYLFVADFAMGKMYFPTSYGGYLPSGYTSIWAKKEKTGLRFDELIVPTDNQVRLKYLIELSI